MAELLALGTGFRASRALEWVSSEDGPGVSSLWVTAGHIFVALDGGMLYCTSQHAEIECGTVGCLRFLAAVMCNRAVHARGSNGRFPSRSSDVLVE
jgi:hypothetical protein